jgi:glutamate synthase (NADPH/NADH) large chain
MRRQKRYVKAINKGLLKVMSKMGISTYQSYCGAQIFEAVGLSSAFVAKYFTGTPTKVEGIGLKEVAEEALRTHRAAFGDDPVLATRARCGGEYAFRVRGEEHMWTPDHRQAAARDALRQGGHVQGIRQAHQRPVRAPHDAARPVRHPPGRAPCAARGGRAGQGDRQALRHRRHVARLDLDRSAHHAGIAMNRIGGKSNTGEGGEDPRASQALKKRRDAGRR